MTAARLPSILVLFLALAACGERRMTEARSQAVRPPEGPAMDRPAPRSEEPAAGESAAAAFDLTEEQWRARLTPEQYEVTRRKGTERPFTGRYWNTKTPGTYRCVCCGLELFPSETKYDSGCGWPSFTAPAEAGAVEETVDSSHGMVRTEITCRRCGAHLGHVFDDGPGPTGLRYCINSASLDLEARGRSSTDGEVDADGDVDAERDEDASK